MKIAELSQNPVGFFNWQGVVGAQDSRVLEDLLSKVLMDPVEGILGRPKKALRARLVELGTLLVRAQKRVGTENPPWISQVVELLHAGSLVIDDIQDGSRLRRGEPTLHMQYGVPVALNAGNWLYFLPLEMIGNLDVAPEMKLKLLEDCHKTLLQAHFGQAVDVGVPMDSLPQERVDSVYTSVARLKSGALTALALKLGVRVSGGTDSQVESAGMFGRDFGVALQRFDDIGNFLRGDSPEKHLEDFRLKRPSHVWASAANHLSQEAYEKFLVLVRDLSTGGPDQDKKQELLGFVQGSGVLIHAVKKARAGLEDSYRQLTLAFPGALAVHQEIFDLSQKLEQAYVA